MGDAVVALVTELAKRLTSEAIKEFGLLWGFKGDVLALKDDFDMIAAVLQDAEEKRSKQEAVKLWLQRLRSASLEVDNLLDEISTEALLQRLHKQIDMKHRVSAFFSSNHNPFMFRIRTAHKVKAIRRKLDAIASRRYELKLTPSSDISHVDVDVASIEVLPESIMYLQNLECLNLSCSCIKVLPKSILYLKNLHYLNLSRSCIKFLPEEITYLQKLQMLYLGCCLSLRKLPDGLKYMRNLHCLDINGVPLKHFPVGIKELTSLRTLSRFPVGKENGAKIGELGDLNLLEGEFRLEQLENVVSLGEAKSAKLECKRNLLDLLLRWSRNMPPEERVDEEVLEGLEPNPSLKKLSIFVYMGMIISPGWLVNLKNLLEIEFLMCKHCEHIPSLGRLPNLRVIKLTYMDSFKTFVDEDTNMLGDTTNMFLSVEELHIFNCPNLVSLPSNLPKLKVLNLEECDALVSLPDEIQSFKHLKKLTIRRCEQLRERYEKDKGVEWHKISHIPHIKI